MKQSLFRTAGVSAGLMAVSLGVAQPTPGDYAPDYQALANIAYTQALRMEAERAEAYRLAPLYGIPTREFTPQGGFRELMAIKEGRVWYLETDNVNAARTTRTNLVHNGGGLGLNLTGSGQLIHIWDGGAVRATHQEYNGRVISGGDGEPLSGDHASHVAGTMIATGVNPAAKGMAQLAKVKSFGFNNDISEIATQVSAGVDPARLSNHSYGYITGWSYSGAWYWYGNPTVSPVEDNGFGLYDLTANQMDQIHQSQLLYLAVKSAGNDRLQGPPSQPTAHFFWNGTGWQADNTTVRNLDGGPTGYDTIPYTATAKNILTVGAVDDVLNYTGPGSVTMSSFSGWGPTDDGRIKPDIVGNGVNLFSAAGSANNAYVIYSGTSMSSPNVTGSLALLRQHYKPLHAGQDMLGSTLKALAIHTADECGSFAGPDYRFGWGLLNTGRAAQLITQDVTNKFVITESILLSGQPQSYWVRAIGGQPLKATMAWTDPAGPVSQNQLDPTARRLVNDLDMRLSRGGVTTFPWIMNPALPNNAAGKGDNDLDNVEQVVINSPVAGGWYNLTIGHEGALTNSLQVFSLIGSGFDRVLEPVSLTCSPGRVIGSMGSTGRIQLNDNAPAPVTFTLESDSTKVVVPATVTVAAGTNAVTFPIKTGTVSNTQIRRITARNGALYRQGTITLEPGGLLSFSITKTIKGGNPLNAVVNLSGNAPTAGQIILTGDNSGKVTMPASVTVPAGTATLSFTVPTLAVTANTLVDTYARMGGTTIVKQVTLTP